MIASALAFVAGGLGGFLTLRLFSAASELERLREAFAFPRPVYFEADSIYLRSEHERELSRFAQVHRHFFPTALVTVEGHYFHGGVTVAESLPISLHQAELVKEFLVQEGMADLAAARWTGVPHAN